MTTDPFHPFEPLTPELFFFTIAAFLFFLVLNEYLKFRRTVTRVNKFIDGFEHVNALMCVAAEQMTNEPDKFKHL